MNSRAARAYKRVSIESASPARILDEIYARLQRDMADACRAIEQGDAAKKGMALGHALRIVAELSATLDHDKAPAVCANLASLYEFVEIRLASANVSMRTEPIREAARVVDLLRQTFQEAQSKAVHE